MSEVKKIIVENLEGSERADKYLASVLTDLSRAGIQRAFEAGLVFRGGVSLAKNAKVSEGEELEFSQPEVTSMALFPVSIPLEIVFEDKHLLAINKESGMVVHPGAGTADNTLVHALLSHCQGQLSGIGGVERPGIVHRLDRETSGLILVAKTDQAHRGLAELFAQRDLEKSYLALVTGAPELLSGTIQKPIGRHPIHRHKMTVVEDEKKGRHARTDWELVERYNAAYSLLRCQILTGRTHQIRVHLTSIRQPLMGDSTYGFRPDPRLPIPPARTMLHASRLKFRHPVTGKELELMAPIPPDFREQVDQLREVFSKKS